MMVRPPDDGPGPPRAQLLGSLMPLIGSLARRHRGHGTAELEDLEQEGALAALRAIDRYDPSLGVPLSTYAHTEIEGAIRRLTRLSRVTRVTRLLESDLPEAPESSAPLEAAEDLAAFERAYHALPPFERLLLSCLYGLEGHEAETEGRIARRLGVDFNAIRAAHRRCRRLLGCAAKESPENPNRLRLIA
jgi:RNA polymerase sigma factor (sigma-70 family)